MRMKLNDFILNCWLHFVAFNSTVSMSECVCVLCSVEYFESIDWAHSKRIFISQNVISISDYKRQTFYEDKTTKTETEIISKLAISLRNNNKMRRKK